MKFKVGDRVKVKEGLVAGSYYNECYFNSSMRIYCGKSFIIKNTEERYSLGSRYSLSGISDWVFSDDMLELDPGFTKADLKDGMIIEHRDGDLFIVLGDRIVAKNGYWTLDDYNDDLTDRNHKGADIVNVYKTKSGVLNDIDDVYNKDYLTLIWERKEEPEYKEMTVEEIEEKLGYKVKVVADK